MDTFDWIMNGTGPRHDAASFVIVVVAILVVMLILNLIGRFVMLKLDWWGDNRKVSLIDPQYVFAGTLVCFVILLPLMEIANGLWALIFDRWLF